MLTQYIFISVPPLDLQIFMASNSNSHHKSTSVSWDPQTNRAQTASFSPFAPVTDGAVLNLREGETSELICYSGGTRPAASILWTTDGVPVQGHLVEVRI